MSGIKAVQTGSGWDVDEITPATSGAVFVPAVKRVAQELLANYDRYGAAGRDVSGMINCHQLVSVTHYADIAALQTAFPAAANAQKAGRVGTAGSYTLAVSNGASWAVTPGVAAYANTGISQTGYTDTTIRTYYTIGTTGPDSGLSAQLIGPITLSGGVPRDVAANYPDIGWYSDAGTFTKGSGGVYKSTFSDPLPNLKVQGGAYDYAVRIQTPGGLKFLSDPAILGSTTNGGVLCPAAFRVGGGGITLVQLDFSQLGLQMHTIEVLNGSESILTAIAIRSGAGQFFAGPKGTKLGLRSIIAGDSLVNTINETTAGKADHQICYSHRLRYTFGIADMMVMSEGGTGYVATGAGGRKTIDKLKYLALLGAYSDCDVIWLPMSINDENGATMPSEMAKAITFASVTWPNALIIVLGSTAGNNTASQAQQVAACNVGRQVIGALGLPNVIFVPTMNRPVQPITGAGIFGGTQDGGTSDFMFNTGDGTHFGANGHQVWEREVVTPSVVDALRTFVAS